MPTRWRITVEYLGSAYVGWQFQPNGPSIQDELERALAKIVGHPVRVEGSGRTDAGVHALGQVAAFTTHTHRPLRAIRDGTNTHLPDDISIVDAQAVPLDFDPRRQVKRKQYCYRWLDRPSRSPWWAQRALFVPRGLNDGAMDRAAQILVGPHDFSSFRSVGCAAIHARRIIQRASVQREGSLVALRVEGNGFLRHMVRIIAGTLTEVGRGRRAPESLAATIAARQRSAAGPTAPPHGLCLEWVAYPSPGDPGREATAQ